MIVYNNDYHIQLSEPLLFADANVHLLLFKLPLERFIGMMEFVEDKINNL